VIDRDGKPRIILDTEVNVVGRSSGRLRLFDEDGTAVVTLSDYLRGEPSLMVGTTMLRVFISGGGYPRVEIHAEGNMADAFPGHPIWSSQNRLATWPATETPVISSEQSLHGKSS